MIVKGGLVQNDPSLPVFDLDVFDCAGTDTTMAEGLDEVRNLGERAR